MCVGKTICVCAMMHNWDFYFSLEQEKTKKKKSYGKDKALKGEKCTKATIMILKLEHCHATMIQQGTPGKGDRAYTMLFVILS